MTEAPAPPTAIAPRHENRSGRAFLVGSVFITLGLVLVAAAIVVGPRPRPQVPTFTQVTGGVADAITTRNRDGIVLLNTKTGEVLEWGLSRRTWDKIADPVSLDEQ